ncbi:MAG: hypothetical protein JNK59_05970 [Sterolibacteriaceae bacterium]|nr:hypothetical protein [Sterolibacteriaceae bacterium]
MASPDAYKGWAYDVRGEYLETKRVDYGADYARLTAPPARQVRRLQARRV